jgi:hypothetical protein
LGVHPKHVKPGRTKLSMDFLEANGMRKPLHPPNSPD